MLKKTFRILLLLCMITIFMFSNQDINNSLTTSDNVTTVITGTITTVTHEEKTSETTQEEINKDNRVIIRKTAHFMAYFTLGILFFIVLYQMNNISLKKAIIFSLIFCITYAISDEIHQIFVSGRTPSIIDVLIDTLGSTIGIAIISYASQKNLVFLKKIWYN